MRSKHPRSALAWGELFFLMNVTGVSKRALARHAGCTRQNVQILCRKWLRRHPEELAVYGFVIPLTRTSEGMRALQKADRGVDVDLWVALTHSQRTGKPKRNTRETREKRP